MKGVGTEAGPVADPGGVRLLVLQARGCRVCVGLDVTEGTYDASARRRREPFTLPTGAVVPALDWSEISGVEADAPEHQEVVTLRTDDTLVGLVVDRCMGVREISFASHPPIPTTLEDDGGTADCFMVPIDGLPHFLVEPRLIERLGQPERGA